MRQLCRSRLHLPAAETFHLAHVLTQAIVGLATGANKKGWGKHILGNKTGDGQPTVVNYFARLEFQDGKRKREYRRPQDYHGRGTVHVHCLVWVENAAAARLETVVSASLPAADAQPQLRAVVLGSQSSWSGSGWPLRDEASVYDPNAGLLFLHHSMEDYDNGIRGYMPDILGPLKSHMDAQASDGRGMLLRYCAGYVPKFSDSFGQEWLVDQASDYAVARRVLNEYHPLEPEMWLQLGSHLQPQVFAGGVIRRFVAPALGHDPADAMPAAVLQYVASQWRREDMTLLEFLRKTSRRGGPAQHLQRRWRREATDGEDVYAFANRAACRGETMAAIVAHSRLSDKYHGQWVLLNVPFRSLADLWLPAVDLVPDGFKGFALALLHRPGHWRDLAAVRTDLEAEAFRDHFVQSIVAMAAAHADVVDGYLSGQLLLGRDAPPRREVGLPGGPVELDREQWQIVDSVDAWVAEAAAAAWPDERAWDEDWDEGPAAPARAQPQAEARQPYAVLGPAGSGKSTAVQVAICRAMGAGARVLVACPTRMLVATYKQKFPELDVDSVHAAFGLFQPEQQTLDSMTALDLIVVEEVGQVSAETFDRLLRLWRAAACRPALVFCGDFAQLRGVDPTRANESHQWRNVRKFVLRQMRRCKCEKLKWKLELLRAHKPDRAQLKRILQGHKAPSRRYRAADRMESAPPANEIKSVFAETPDTTFVTITRRGAAWVNQVALELFFEAQEPLARVPGDPEGNPENYRGTTQENNEPVDIPVYKGMRITFTKNVNKDVDYVNGMGAEVLGACRSGVRARTDTGHVVVLYPWTDEDKVVYYPFRLGYAHTLLKVQGATLRNLTLWLDKANIEAAGYVALSRVEFDRNWRYVGDPTVHHFTPAGGF